MSVENEDYTYRIDHLRRTRAHGEVPVARTAAWAIARSRSDGNRLGHRRWRVRPRGAADGYRWVTDIRDQCRRARVPFFFKQWGGVQKHRAGRELDGRTWDEMPRPKPLVVNLVDPPSWSGILGSGEVAAH